MRIYDIEMSSKRIHDVDDPTEDALKATSFAQQIFSKPVRSPADLGKWKRSHAYNDLITYINNTSMAIQGHRQNSKDFVVTRQMEKLSKIFNWLERLVQECHPLGIGHGLLRCVGNDKINMMDSTLSLRQKCHRAYRHWVKLVQERVYSILELQVKPHCKHINELAQYLTRSFGSLQQYDYGPGHELMFVFYLCSLFKSGILGADDTVAAVLLLFQRYLDLVRRLTSFFRLTISRERDSNVVEERNVLPYIWGCAQLCRSHPFDPPQWELPAVMETYRKNYMLLSSLEHLQKKMNHVALGVHSYQLWCVLSLSNWPDAYTGLMASYVKHVLSDFYTIQDLVFCEMLSFTRQPSEYLQQAFLGEPPELPTPTSSTDDSEEQEEEKVEEEDDSETEQLMQESRHIQAIEKKRKLNEKTRILYAACLPVPLYRNLKTDVFLGFQDPRKPIEKPDDATAHVLRRPRCRHEAERRETSPELYNNQNKTGSLDSENAIKVLTGNVSGASYYTI
ncbi:PREDICTED: serine/threonine-protein phosphatase 2A activator [Drosophila arizonae]|uniref:Serine/threonine-protein phosphatase 2A activator n=1 Tax=Drosophila arizonae TaxID=7263 RepID=A0ABM1PW90_DROAR|nr:PREDICTED: serine/threonine-protein phosphatase 2A activator [Drosophila arizonae]